MATEQTLEWMIDHRFDPQRCRHTLNGVTSVLHCHHFASLYSQLAEDAAMVDGKALLRKAAELSFYPVLQAYFAEHGITRLEDRLALAGEYFKLIGLGAIKFDCVGSITVSVHMTHSHVDEGWVRKWGTRETPVNFIGQGFLAAAVAAAYDLPVGSYSVREPESIVAGAPVSRFTIVRA